MTAQGTGRLILLCGLSGSGKTTLGYLLVKHLNEFGTRRAFLLDGDAARAFFGTRGEYASDARHDAAVRLAFGAYTLVQENVDVVMANIAALSRTRQFFRDTFAQYVEVYLEADIQELIKHDVKGVYRQALAEDPPQLVGHDLPFEKPEDPDVTVYPYRERPEESLRRIVDALVQRGPTMGTKADTLQSLAGQLSHGAVPPQLTLTQRLFERNPLHYVELARDLFHSEHAAVRSSSKQEDGRSGSGAGRFTSLLDVPLQEAPLRAAIKAVVDDYAAKKLPNPQDAQILLQPMVADVSISGVVFTRHEFFDSPYYVVNYDDHSGRTDTVTAGVGGKSVFISRFAEPAAQGRWQTLLAAVGELEQLFPNIALDIEFVINSDGEVVILQCRRLSVEQHQTSLEQHAREALAELKLRLQRFQQPHPPLSGSCTVLSDMSDWNPAEMLGEKPTSLAYSLYRELITEDIWYRARADQGYFDVGHAPLMVSLARKSYIDTRASFNSLVPAEVEPSARERLVEHYLNTLREHPELHDKIEFEVAISCFDLQTASRLRQVETLDDRQRFSVTEALRRQTDALILGAENTIRADLDLLDALYEHIDQVLGAYREPSGYWGHFQAAYLLLQRCKTLGTLPFARLARLGFVAKCWLRSLREQDLISAEFETSFFAGIQTVASEFSDDCASLCAGELDYAEFCRRYGHLRMSTYHITAPRYDQMPQTVWRQRSRAVKKPATRPPADFNPTAVNNALRAANLSFDSKHLFGFARKATEARERAKLQFTRAVSEALEAFARGGEALSLSREELQHLTLPTLFRFRNPEFSSPAKAAAYLRARVKEKRSERSVHDLIKLPAVLARATDIDLVALLETQPNFVTQKRVLGTVVCLGPATRPDEVELKEAIVAIENADPGYDWIFSCGLSGLITQYGGAASHMAIRCFEFGLPGAIGCGERLFSEVCEAQQVLLDCGGKVISRV